MHHRMFNIKWAPFMGLKNVKKAISAMDGKIDVLAHGHQGELAMLRKSRGEAPPKEWRALQAGLEPHSLLSSSDADQPPAITRREGARPFFALDANTSPAENAYFEITFRYPYGQGPLEEPQVKNAHRDSASS